MIRSDLIFVKMFDSSRLYLKYEDKVEKVDKFLFWNLKYKVIFILNKKIIKLIFLGLKEYIIII